MVLSEKKKNKGVYCCAYACRNKPIKKLGELCPKHYWRKRRVIDPVYCRYNQFKGNAKRRGKEFHVTLDQFRKWCKDNGYLSKGMRGQNATIDRRCNCHGYYIWNMQLLSLVKNASKGNRFSGNDFTGPDLDGEELPF